MLGSCSSRFAGLLECLDRNPNTRVLVLQLNRDDSKNFAICSNGTRTYADNKLRAFSVGFDPRFANAFAGRVCAASFF